MHKAAAHHIQFELVEVDELATEQVLLNLPFIQGDIAGKEGELSDKDIGAVLLNVERFLLVDIDDARVTLYVKGE